MPKKKSHSSSSSDSPPLEKQKTSQTLVKVCLVLGILSLILLPVATLKLAEWKLRQERNARADAILINQSPEDLKFGGQFSLVDHNGRKVTEATYRGKYLFVYFGYTFCPDLCPTALQNLTETLDALGEDAEKIRVLFITIDPERDTKEKLKEYVESFHPNIIGLTGSAKQISEAAKAFGVTYRKAKANEEDEEEEDYIMEHTTLTFLLDPDGKPIASIDMEEVDPLDLARALRRLWSGKIKPASNEKQKTDQQ